MKARLLGILISSALAGATSVSTADVAVNINIGPPPPPIVVVAPPALVVVPGIQQYAPSLQVDVFLHEHRWYYPHGGYWNVGPSYRGPWTPITFSRLPAPIVAVPIQYYKVPPGHLKHAEKGDPPGHAKGKGKGRE